MISKTVAIVVCSLLGVTLFAVFALGLMRGLQAHRAAVAEELTEAAQSIINLSQNYSITPLPVDEFKEIKPLPIEKLTLPVNVLKTLKAEGFDTIGELMTMTAEELSQIPNIDRASADAIATEIQRFIRQHIERDGAKDAPKAPGIDFVP